MGHSTSSGRNAAVAPQAAETRTPETRTTAAAERRANFEEEIDRATFSGNGNIRSFQIPGIGAAQVRAGRDEFGNHGWVASVATPNSNLAPINGGRAFSSREQAEAMARDRLKNRVRFLRQEAREERAAMEARERSQSSANRPLIPPVGRTSTRRSGIRRRSGGGFET